MADPCEKCAGAGWIWGHEKDIEPDCVTDQRYTCDVCFGENAIERPRPKPQPASLTPEMLGEEDRDLVKWLKKRAQACIFVSDHWDRKNKAAIALCDRLLNQGEG